MFEVKLKKRNTTKELQEENPSKTWHFASFDNSVVKKTDTSSLVTIWLSSFHLKLVYQLHQLFRSRETTMTSDDISYATL